MESPDALQTALYGKDPTPGLVALHPLGRGGSETVPDGEAMRLYFRHREADGTERVETETVPYWPFFFLTDRALLDGFPPPRFRVQRLDGPGVYRELVAFPDRGAYFDALRHVARLEETEKRIPDTVYTVGGPEQQYLMQSGRTLFKGMGYDDLHRLQLDIEVYAPDGFPKASREHNRIIIVALSDNRGWSRLVDDRHLSEQSVLQETVRLIQERDPDVIEGHNIYGFDYAYLQARCARHGVRFAIGRDGSVPRSFPSSMRFAERSIEFEALEIAGRHTIDTLFQVMSFDVFKRDLPNYTLKGAAKYFGFAPEGRTYIEGSALAETWDADPERVLEYALDDVTETRLLAERLSGSTFYLTQMVPMPYGAVARTGPATKIEALFVREYLRQRAALPRAGVGSQVVGGYTDVFVTGVVGPMVYADVESLYPSIMLGYDVRPSGDSLGLFPGLLKQLTDLRFETKGLMKQAEGPEEVSELDARQTAYKNIINCFTSDTDILTADGVKRVGEVEVGDLVYSLDPASGTAAYKPVTRSYRQDRYVGEMVALKNAFVDLVVTPNHRLYTQPAPAGRPAPGYAWREAADLFESRVRHRLPPVAPLVAPPEHAVSLKDACGRLGIPFRYDPETDRIKDPRQQAKWIPNTYRMTDWLQLCGWYVSEGSVYTGTRKDYGYTVRGEATVVQIANKTPDERDQIEALCARMGLHASESVNGFTISNLLLGEILKADFGNGSAEKRLPAWIWDLDGRLLRNLLHTAYLGDGNKSQGRYNTQSRRLADDFVRLAFHCGKRARLRGQDSGCWRVAYYDRARGVRPEIKAEHRTRVPYDGPIECLEVADFHTVLAGRNGTLNWVGQSFYGNLGFGLALFNDFAEADRVAATGQDLLRQIIALVRGDGGRVIEVDTDGVLFVPPEGVAGEAAERAYVSGLSDRMPEGIRIGFDGRFRRMLSYKKKNYALERYDGTLKLKGSSLLSRSIERFGREFVREAIRLLLAEDIAGLHALYLKARDQIIGHDWRSVRSFQRVETLKESADRYLADVAEGKRTRAASYELAIRRAEAGGPAVKVGDRIAYYIGGTGANVRAFEAARLASEWDPEDPDENTAYYLGRLDQFAAKFQVFFASDPDFRLVFSPEDLFGFDPSGIRLQTTERPPEEVESEVPF